MEKIRGKSAILEMVLFDYDHFQRLWYFSSYKPFLQLFLRNPQKNKEQLLGLCKLGKPAYDTSKAFRSIVVLNTLGKLIKKMIARQLQFDTIKYSILYSN